MKKSTGLRLYTAAGMGGSLRPCANVLRCRTCHVQLPEFSTGFGYNGLNHFVSLPKSVGEVWFGQFPKCVVQRDLQRIV